MQAREVVLRWKGVPHQKLRGNARGHWTGRVKYVQDMRNLGLVLANSWRNSQERGELPIKGPYELRVDVWVKRWIDGDNLIIGYKSFVDGMVHARIIEDDRRIKRWTIEVNLGSEELSIVRVIGLEGLS